jgi:hypothetical protein
VALEKRHDRRLMIEPRVGADRRVSGCARAQLERRCQLAVLDTIVLVPAATVRPCSRPVKLTAPLISPAISLEGRVAALRSGLAGSGQPFLRLVTRFTDRLARKQ